MPREEHEYLLHELREETGHSLMFLRAIEAGGLALPVGSWREPRIASALGRFAPAGGGLFWLAMLIGEDVSDKFNRYVRSQRDEINPTVRQICTLHVVDEARHISFARCKLENALAGAGIAPRHIADLELYDTRSDPGEYSNVIGQHAEIAAELRQLLAAHAARAEVSPFP